MGNISSLGFDKKQTSTIVDIMIAFSRGAEIQYKQKGDIIWNNFTSENPSWSWNEFDYRIKPAEPKLRPWKVEEVPVGALIKAITNSSGTGLIVMAEFDSIRFGQCGHITTMMAEISYIHSTDSGKTWLPCGIYE